MEEEVLKFAEKALSLNPQAYSEVIDGLHYRGTILMGDEYVMTIRKDCAPSLGSALCRGNDTVAVFIQCAKTNTMIEYHSNISVDTRVKLGTIIHRNTEKVEKEMKSNIVKQYEKFMNDEGK